MMRVTLFVLCYVDAFLMKAAGTALARPKLYRSGIAVADDALISNAVAYLAQHPIVLLAPDDIRPTLQEAYRRAEFRQHRYASLHTGPSATADIEGVIIRGAQGVRSLTVILEPAR